MARAKTIYECTTCGDQAPKWMGRCNGCGHWNTLVESVIGGNAPVGPTAVSAAPKPTAGHRPAVPIDELDALACVPLPTGIDEFDRVLGGGLVAGSITLVGGEPGVGKSTLLTQVTAAWAERHGPVLSVSAEESPQQVSARFKRLELGGKGVHVGGDCNINGVLSDLASLRPKLAIVDSIQTVFDPDLSSAPGSVAQVRQCSHRLAVAAREYDCAIVLVGQVTKDGGLAGPRVLEHLVDTVLAFDGERELGLRVLRALKHRFGATGELGVFEMTGQGLMTVDDPSGRMLGDRLVDVAGSAVAVTIEGRRAVVLEMQGLVVVGAPNPRRSSQGYDQKRLAMLLAVLEKQMSLGVSQKDVYLSVVGGMRINEPGSDLAACAAIASSAMNESIAADVVAIGEVGLAGELRSASAIDRRLQEASRLGFKKAVIPQSDVAAVDVDMQVVGATNVVAALDALGLHASNFKPIRSDQAQSQPGRADARRRADAAKRAADSSFEPRYSEFNDLLLDRGDGSATGQLPDGLWSADDRPPVQLVPDDGW